MKKLFIIALVAFLATAGLAGATDFTITGSYYSRGTYVDNWDGTAFDNAGDSYGVFDQELSLDTKWTIDDTTGVVARFEIRDDNWADGDDGTRDDNIEVQRAWGYHTFGNGGTLSVGQMTGGAWGTSFADQAGAAYRIKYVLPTSMGTLIGLYQKVAEGTTTNNDYDVYGILGVTKVAGISLFPGVLLYDNENTENKAWKFALAAKGGFGNIGWEAEGEFMTFDAAIDYTLYGLYGNIWAQLDALKIGALAAFGNEDEGNYFDFDDDFTAGGALLLGDDVFMNDAAGQMALRGVTLIALYADYAVNDKLSFGVYLGYASSHADDNSNMDGATATEISGDITYKITPNLTYSVAAGTAQLEYGSGFSDPEAALEINNKLAFSF